jgi:hypothetical protein
MTSNPMIEIIAIITLLQHPAVPTNRGGVVIWGESGIIDPSATPEEELDRLIDGGIKTYNYVVRMNDEELSSSDFRLNRGGDLKLTIEASRPETTYLTVTAKPDRSNVTISFLARKKSSQKALARTIIKLSLEDSRPAVIDRLFFRLTRFGKKADSQVPLTVEALHEGPVPSFEDMVQLAILMALRAYGPDPVKDRLSAEKYRKLLDQVFQKLEEL